MHTCQKITRFFSYGQSGPTHQVRQTKSIQKKKYDELKTFCLNVIIVNRHILHEIRQIPSIAINSLFHKIFFSQFTRKMQRSGSLAERISYGVATEDKGINASCMGKLFLNKTTGPASEDERNATHHSKDVHTMQEGLSTCRNLVPNLR